MLTAGVVIFTLLLLCRFMPGPKCVTYCKLKKLKREAAKEKIRDMVKFTPRGDFQSIDFSHLSTDTINKLYENSAPFGCSDLLDENGKFKPEEEWFAKARMALQEAIAERHLLEIK